MRWIVDWCTDELGWRPDPRNVENILKKPNCRRGGPMGLETPNNCDQWESQPNRKKIFGEENRCAAFLGKGMGWLVMKKEIENVVNVRCFVRSVSIQTKVVVKHSPMRIYVKPKIACRISKESCIVVVAVVLQPALSVVCLKRRTHGGIEHAIEFFARVLSRMI